jgi:hypothetical protein
MVKALHTVLLVALLAAPVLGQSHNTTSDQNYPARLLFAPRNTTFELLGGMTIPMSHASLKNLWLRGPSARVAFYFKANDRTRFGVGIDAALFSFRRGMFAAIFPGVPVQAKNLTTIHVYMGMRNYLKPSVRMTPFLGAEVGVVRCSGAEYKAIISGVRHTYYDIPGMAHLAASVSAGVDYYLVPHLAVQLEGRAIYVVNDPDMGLFLTAHAGFKFAL